MEYIWKPQPKQAIFMSSPEYEVFYGGAAGGGKSDALVCEALRQIDHPSYKAIIFRKTFPQLEDLIWKTKNYYPKVCPKAKYNKTQHVWQFPSGALIYFGSMPHQDSYEEYQGKSYSFIGFDELTHFSEKEYRYLMSRNRADAKGLRVYIRATGNPGGIGHGWVKERFITAMPPNTTFTYRDTVVGKNGEKIEIVRTRKFVPSSVFDNKALLSNDPNYIANLGSLPEAEKRALLYGEWDSFSGQVFTEWRNNPEGYKTHQFSHVIEPFEIPKSWTRYRAYDFGFTKPFAMYWAAVSPDGVIYLYRELYGCTKTPNEGIKKEGGEQAQMVREIEDEFERGNEIYGVADPAIWDESRGKEGCVVDAFARQGIYFEKGKNARISGKMQFHNRLRFDEKGNAMFYVFNTCKHFIRTVPNLVYSQIHVEDIDTNGEDHAYDAVRYLFMAKPIAPKQILPPIYSPKNPLDKF